MIENFGVQHWVSSPIELWAMGGLIFACGRPVRAAVRWLFNYIDRNRDASITDVARELHNLRDGPGSYG